MHVPVSVPSARLKTLVTASRWVWRLLLAGWLLFLLAWVGLHLIIVPRIAELRPQLEAWASSALGVPVRIDALSADSPGLIPSVEIRGVRLLDAQGREALLLPRIQATLSPQSLWRRGFDQLYIEGLHVQLRRAADGRLFVGSLQIPTQDDAGGSVADWFFSQAELVIRNGSIDWTDEMQGGVTVPLGAVNFVMRNGVRSHMLRLDAQPPSAWGSSFTLMMRMRSPLLSLHPGRWRDWDGQIHALMDRVDLAWLKDHVELGEAVQGGSGMLRTWVDIKAGDLIGGTADVQLAEVGLGGVETSKRLKLARLEGRLNLRRWQEGFELWTENLNFQTADGMPWPGGNIRFRHSAASATNPERGELQGERLDLQALARVALQLPMSPPLAEKLTALQPRGQIERIQASWQGDAASPQDYLVKGHVTQLATAALTSPVASSVGKLQVPGVQGLDADFEINPSGGQASLTLKEGQVELPGWFEDPNLTFGLLKTEASWRIDGERLSIQMPKLTFSNPDAQGELQLNWRTGEAAADRFPGVLDLQGSMSRAAGHRVYRYLPLEVPGSVRNYLRHAVTSAPATAVRFRVKGNLGQFPFAKAGQGEFRVSAQLRDATFAYLPAAIQSSGELPWPALAQLNTEFLMDRHLLQLKKASARVAGASAIRVTKAEATIPDFMINSVVEVQATVAGPLNELLARVVGASPLSTLTDHFLDRATGSGSAEVQFGLRVPLSAPEKTSVQGRIALSGNDLQLTASLPRLQSAQGLVHFNEKGFALSGVRARALGGELRAEGGTIFLPGSNPARGALPRLNLSGQVTADGLRQSRELGEFSRLAQQINGQTSFSASLGWREGATELLLNSSLQGMGSSLPPPFDKRAEAALPLRLELRPHGASNTKPAQQDRFILTLGQVASADYVRDLTGRQPKVVRGAVGIGLGPDEAPPLPTTGVVALARFDKLDLDSWRALLPANRLEGDSGATDYLPTSLALRATALILDGRPYEQLVAGGSREGSTWRFNLDARELSGYLEYQNAKRSEEGLLYARLARLVLAPSATAQVEKLLDIQPQSIPALDVVVGDLELLGKKLGRLEIEALNRGDRNWQLRKLNITLPEARFTAAGNWGHAVELGGTRSRVAPVRRTLMDFKLDIEDAGVLLTRLGMKDLVRKGHGKLEGQVVWRGSPMAIDYPTLDGSFQVNIEGGQFLKADPGIAKLLGVLSLQTLPRRLMLDFRDVFSEGFVFDFVRGDVKVQQGIASSNNLQMKGANAAVLMEGRVDIDKETQNLKVVVVPEINAGTASLITSWINPVAGLTSFLAQLLLRQPLIESATQEFRIEGSWADPKVVRTDTGKEIKR